jgi:hypothetical protein
LDPFLLIKQFGKVFKNDNQLLGQLSASSNSAGRGSPPARQAVLATGWARDPLAGLTFTVARGAHAECGHRGCGLCGGAGGGGSPVAYMQRGVHLEHLHGAVHSLDVVTAAELC